MTPETKVAVDAVALGTGFASWFALLPDIAALLSIVWVSIRIWETRTVRRWTGRK